MKKDLEKTNTEIFYISAYDINNFFSILEKHFGFNFRCPVCYSTKYEVDFRVFWKEGDFNLTIVCKECKTGITLS